MREILFRGKRVDTGEWVEGYIYEHQPPLQCLVPENYIAEKSKWYIARTAFADWNMPRQVEFIEIDNNTVGQFTGLLDKNGKKIFEGDIVSFEGNVTADNTMGFEPNGFFYDEDSIHTVIWNNKLYAWDLDFTEEEKEAEQDKEFCLWKYKRDTRGLLIQSCCEVIDNLNDKN